MWIKGTVKHLLTTVPVQQPETQFLVSVSVTKLLCLLTELTRHHHRAYHDHAQHHRQEVPPQSLLRDRHGPVRVCLLHLRFRRTYRVWHFALLCQQQKAECQKGQEEEEPGEHLSKTTTGKLQHLADRKSVWPLKALFI